jgi:hypothetical protein
MNDLEGSRLFRAWRTMLEMLSDRGYNVDARLLAYNEADFEALCPTREAMTLHVHHNERRDRQLRVIFVGRETVGPAAVLDGKVRKASVLPLMRRLGNGTQTRGIFVFADDLSITPAATTVMTAINEESPGMLQWFAEEELVVNLGRRERGYGTRYRSPFPAGVSSGDLGRLYEVDPVARYYNAQQGDVVHIVRRSETSGLTVSYKRCVPNDEIRVLTLDEKTGMPSIVSYKVGITGEIAKFNDADAAETGP